MAIDAIGLPPSSSTATSTRSSISQTDFLQILLTQLRFQDPLKPVDDTQFVAQLAQFSALEIAGQQNAKLDSVLTMQNTSQAVALMGRKVAVTAQDLGTSTYGTVSAVTFSDKGVPSLTLTPAGTGATTVDVHLSDVTLIQPN